MRFASNFSVVTDNRLRENTVRRWTEKIIEYIYDNEEVTSKVTRWIRELQPDIKEQRISLEIHKLIIEAFKSSMQVILIIDELTPEQKGTISNVIKSFKLENCKCIDFQAFVVRLEQRISLLNSNAEYAISVQK